MSGINSKIFRYRNWLACSSRIRRNLSIEPRIICPAILQIPISVGVHDLGCLTASNPMNPSRRLLIINGISALGNKSYKEFKKAQILAYKDSQLEEEYPEFKALIQEYHDGILLFNISKFIIFIKMYKCYFYESKLKLKHKSYNMKKSYLRHF